MIAWRVTLAIFVRGKPRQYVYVTAWGVTAKAAIKEAVRDHNLRGKGIVVESGAVPA